MLDLLHPAGTSVSSVKYDKPVHLASHYGQWSHFGMWSDKLCGKSMTITVIFRPIPKMIRYLDKYLS